MEKLFGARKPKKGLDDKVGVGTGRGEEGGGALDQTIMDKIACFDNADC